MPAANDATRVLGREGEDAAVAFLKQRGYRILARNYVCPAGEIDVVGLDQDQIVFFEVKTRRSEKASDPELAVNLHKRRQVTQAARYFVMQQRLTDRPCRFDVLALVMPLDGAAKVEHFIDAFAPARARRR